MEIDNSNYQPTQDNTDGVTTHRRHERILSLLVIAILSLLTGNDEIIIFIILMNFFRY
jgi:hypothetical protein